MVRLTLKGKADYIDKNARRTSIIIKRAHKNAGAENEPPLFDYIRIGSSFRRVRADNAVEIANITGVSTDSFGIPHIRYDMQSQTKFSSGKQQNGSKMLALPTFIDLFSKR